MEPGRPRPEAETRGGGAPAPCAMATDMAVAFLPSLPIGGGGTGAHLDCASPLALSLRRAKAAEDCRNPKPAPAHSIMTAGTAVCLDTRGRVSSSALVVNKPDKHGFTGKNAKYCPNGPQLRKRSTSAAKPGRHPEPTRGVPPPVVPPSRHSCPSCPSQ